MLQIYLSVETSLLVKDTISLLLREWVKRERVEQLNSIVKSNGGLLKKLSAPGALFIWIALDENCKHWSNCIGNQQDCSNDMMQSLLPLPLDLIAATTREQSMRSYSNHLSVELVLLYFRFWVVHWEGRLVEHLLVGKWGSGISLPLLLFLLNPMVLDYHPKLKSWKFTKTRYVKTLLTFERLGNVFTWVS